MERHLDHGERPEPRRGSQPQDPARNDVEAQHGRDARRTEVRPVAPEQKCGLSRLSTNSCFHVARERVKHLANQPACIRSRAGPLLRIVLPNEVLVGVQEQNPNSFITSPLVPL